MKTIIKIQILALLGISLAISACEKEVMEIPASTMLPPETLLEKTEPAPHKQQTYNLFNYQVAVQDCSRNGKTLEVKMPSYNGYTFAWKLDGVCAGTAAQLLCVNALSATIEVTRRSDGRMVSKTIDLSTDPSLNSSFDFSLVESDCFSGGKTLEARTLLDGLSYAFLWEIDGYPAGHYRKLNCVCGQVAKVKVTRLSDGAVMTRQAVLPPCSSED